MRACMVVTDMMCHGICEGEVKVWWRCSPAICFRHYQQSPRRNK